MRKGLFSTFIISGLLFCPVTIADTPVSGIITGHEVWDVNGSPYVFVDRVQVQEEASLTIEPNTVVHIYSGSSSAYHRSLNVYGSLLAEECEFILETSGLNASYVGYNPGSTGSLTNCKITTTSGGNVMLGSDGAEVIGCTGQNATIRFWQESSVVRNCAVGILIFAGYASPTVSSNTILSSVKIEGNSTPVLTGNIFHGTVAVTTTGPAEIHGNVFKSQLPYDLSLSSPWSGISGNTYEHESPIHLICGVVQGSRTLGDLDGISRYQLSDNITIPANASLAIQPETEVVFPARSGYQSCWAKGIAVYGELTTMDGCTVVLQADGSCSGSITFLSGSSGNISNTQFPGGGVIGIASTDVSVTGCDLSTALSISGGQPDIQHNQIHNTITISTDQAVKINDNTIYPAMPYNIWINSPTSGISGNTYEHESPLVGIWGDVAGSRTLSPCDGLSKATLTERIMIPDEALLTIEPAMDISIYSYYSYYRGIDVYGQLVAHDCRFVLGRDPSALNEGMIIFHYGSGEIGGCEISGGTYGQLRIQYSDHVTISDSNITCPTTTVACSPEIRGNTFATGLTCAGGSAPSILYNTFTTRGTAITIEDVSNPQIHYNSFNPAGMGVNNTGPQIVDATYNWWGDPTGPGPVGPGNGAKVSDKVLYDPWLGGEICKIQGVVTYDDNGQQGAVAGIPVYVYQEGISDHVWEGKTNSSGQYEVDAYHDNYNPDGPQRFYAEAKWEDEVIRIKKSIFVYPYACIWYGNNIEKRLPSNGFMDCGELHLTFSMNDAQGIYFDAEHLFRFVHEANDYVSQYNPLIRPITQIDGFIYAQLIGGKSCLGDIAFTRTWPSSRPDVWHEYGHSIHYQMTQGKINVGSSIGEGWAYYFGEYLSGNQTDDNNITYSPADTEEHAWGRVYSSIFNDIEDPADQSDQDLIDGQTTHYDQKDQQQVTGEQMVWKVIMEDQAKDIDDFYEKFLDRYLDLQLPLFAIYNSHGLYLTTTPTTTNQILQTQTQTTTTTTDSSIAKGKFFLSWSGSDLDLTLTAPDSTFIDPCYAASDPNITFVEDANTEYYLIDNPQPGQWLMHIEAVNVPPEGESYTATAYLTTNLVLILSTDRQIYDSNEPIMITTKILYDSNSYSDANVVAEIKRPDGNETIILYDDGLHNDANSSDGIYANTYSNTLTEGDYEIIATASGRNPFAEFFVRQTRKTVLVKNLPDLIPIDITTTDEPIQGQILLTATILNTGSAHANDILVEFYDVTDTNIFRIDPNTVIDYLEPNQARQVSVIWEANFGTHHLFVVVDPNDTIPEKDETNNYTSQTYSIGCIFRADFNNDWFVTIEDVAEFVNYWLDPCPIDEWCQGRDIDKSGAVDFADFAILSTEFALDHCPP